MGLFSLYKKNSLIKKVYNLFNQGKYQEALKSFDEALKLNPNCEPALKAKENISNIKM